MGVEIKQLFGRLNELCLGALHDAVMSCASSSHYSVEIEHWLLKLVDRDDSDLRRIFKRSGVRADRVVKELSDVIGRFKTGNARKPAFAPSVEELVREAWLLTSAQFMLPKIRSGVLLLALLSKDSLARQILDASPELKLISLDQLREKLLDTAAGSPEEEAIPPPEAAEGQPRVATARTTNLDQYTQDLTARARAGQIDPVLGRESEIRLMVDILTRRRQNNPILTGEAGVGKTAVVEGFALKVAAGDVPPSLRNVAVRSLDLGLLQAGAGVKGEFENRLKGVINEVKASPVPIILFIDEAHTMIGAGGQAGQSDAANLLKPALARGELRTIAATTWAEFKKYFEKDAALSRRFQVVKVDEPTEDQAIIMMRGLVQTLETHHNVRVLDEAVRAAVKLSARYITGRQLPDKAVSLLDTTCAKVAISQHAIPAAIERVDKHLAALDTEITLLQREALTQAIDQDRLAALHAQRQEQQTALTALQERFQQEIKLVQQIRDLREQIEREHAATQATAGDQAAAAPTPTQRSGQLDTLTAQLRQHQGDEPLTLVNVDAQAVAEVVSGWTGIPVGRMQADEIQTILALQQRLEQRVVGQSAALDAICQRVRTARAMLTDPRRPIGVFMLVGPSGVGKTETALALAETLYGGERNLVVINMSEYQEKHTVSGLKGSPPGYVGYGEGGVLTEAVRRKPYSVVLLDEVEKAHSDVHELFYQVFDKGMLEDGEGREIDFKNTVILLTSNVGTDTIMRLCANPQQLPTPEQVAEALRPDLLDVFQPAFLGRLILVPYLPISEEVMKRIIRLQLSRVADRLKREHKATLAYDETLIDQIAARCTEVASGARNVDHILTRTLLPAVSTEILGLMSQDRSFSRVHVGVGSDGQFLYDIT